MADFLTRLAMRIGEPEGFVRPRLPSLFEPSHLDPALPIGGEAASVELRSASSERGMEEIARDERSHEAEALAAPDARPADAQPRRRAPGERKQPRLARSPETVIETPEARPQEEPPAARLTQPLPAPSPLRPASSRVSQADPVEAGPPPPPPLARPSQPRRERSAEPVVPPPPSIAAEQPLALPAATTQRLPPRQPDIVRPRVAIHDRTAPSSIEGERAIEPTIHVTIGRIDVRAVAPAAPTRRTERDASPVMSLDEYLRTRAR